MSKPPRKKIRLEDGPTLTNVELIEESDLIELPSNNLKIPVDNEVANLLFDHNPNENQETMIPNSGNEQTKQTPLISEKDEENSKGKQLETDSHHTKLSQAFDISEDKSNNSRQELRLVVQQILDTGLPTNNEELNHAVTSNSDEPSPGKLSGSSSYIVTASDTGPSIYNVSSDMMSPLFAPKHLAKAFESLPIYRKALPESEREADNDKLLHQFVGESLDDDQFERLQAYCSPENLRLGTELDLQFDSNVQGNILASMEFRKVLATAPGSLGEGDHLHTVRRFNMRLQRDVPNTYMYHLKYRSIKRTPVFEAEDFVNGVLEPGKELIYRFRIYRPFLHDSKKGRNHPLFCRDLVMLGSQRLSQLRDHIVCSNDFGMRADVSCYDTIPVLNAKDMFPSGFLFINNLFYNDLRDERCADLSAPIRAWASRRGIGDFPHRDMDVRLDELEVRLGYPEVYVHQGNCEHLFTLSEVRLLGPRDRLNAQSYPFEGTYSTAQIVYCNTCAELATKWVVTGGDRVPFDPAYLCETCYRLYFFKGKAKLGDFKAYPYVSPDQRTSKL